MDLSNRTVLPQNEIMFSTCSPLLVVVSLWCFLTLPCITILPLKIHESALVPYFDDKWVYVWCCILGFLTCVVLRKVTKVYENTKTCTKKVFIKSRRMETITYFNVERNFGIAPKISRFIFITIVLCTTIWIWLHPCQIVELLQQPRIRNQENGVLLYRKMLSKDF